MSEALSMPMVVGEHASSEPAEASPEPKGMAMIVFSGELDKALAAFIVANGAAAMDVPVTMFFTFWGLNVLRREGSVPLKAPKTTTERMFGRMMPKGPNGLKLSRMNMAGLGTRMIKREMVKKHVIDLPHLVRTAQDQGVRLIACTMSMDLMGIKKEELIPGVDLGGVGSFINVADHSRITLFV